MDRQTGGSRLLASLNFFFLFFPLSLRYHTRASAAMHNGGKPSGQLENRQTKYFLNTGWIWTIFCEPIVRVRTSFAELFKEWEFGMIFPLVPGQGAGPGSTYSAYSPESPWPGFFRRRLTGFDTLSSIKYQGPLRCNIPSSLAHCTRHIYTGGGGSWLL